MEDDENNASISQKSNENEKKDDDEIDPLDAFMVNINEQAKKDVDDSVKRDKKVIRLDDINDKEEINAENADVESNLKHKIIEDGINKIFI